MEHFLKSKFSQQKLQKSSTFWDFADFTMKLEDFGVPKYVSLDWFKEKLQEPLVQKSIKDSVFPQFVS